MENLPEDQQRNDESPPSSPEPEGAAGFAQDLGDIAGGLAMLNVVQEPPPLEIVFQQPFQQPLLLRHASVSSLDESSQKCRDTNAIGNSNSAGGIQDSSRPQYKNSSHPQRAFGQLSCMRDDSLLTDVTLVAAGYEVKAHKAVLAACSPYFYAMFTGFDEKNKSRIILRDIDPEALKILINYVYTSEVEVSEENVQNLLPAANIMQLADVKEACCEFLLNQLHPTNCLGIKSFADLHGCLDLLAVSNTYIESHFAEVLDCDEFYALDQGQVCSLISSDTITVPSEEKVYESVIAWVNFDRAARGQSLPKLMEHVRLPLLSRDYLLKKVDGEGLFQAHPECKDFIIEALKFHLANGQGILSTHHHHHHHATSPSSLAEAVQDLTSVFNSPRTKLRQPIGLPKVLLAIGGQAPKAVRSVECYSFKEDRWVHLSDMPVRRCRCGVASVRGLVYAVGGFNGSLRVRTVDVYDPVRDAWSSAPNMEARRSTLGVAVLNDCIYAVGGFDGSTGLNSAEVLDLTVSLPSSLQTSSGFHEHHEASRRRREWRPIANMSTRRSSVGVGVVGGIIYAVGGYDGNSRQCLASVEVYYPSEDTWKRVSDMSARRSGAGVGVVGGIIYAVGGHDGPLVRKSVECYNPDRDEWTAVSEMNNCRRNAGVITNGGLLYVIGGDDGSSNLQSVEVYNPKTDIWTVLNASMSLGRSYTGVCIIDKPDSI